MTDTERRSDNEVVHVAIDGVAVEATPGELLIDAAERAGIFIPRFCYHPRMAPVGMCRMCLVEVSGPRGFSLLPSCFVQVADGQEVLTSSDKARKAQEGVLEFLLVNHPLDCPVCDKGGECPLQDQALSHGPGESRFVEEKRHWAKPIALSPLVNLDRERCIQCARCTRFADELAGEALIDFAFRGDEVEVATFPSRPFSSYFSGNTVQICPVGALTATPYRFRSRPWDLEQVESTCTTCALGCRIVAQSSAGRYVRNLGVDATVNESWLCDKGRFGYEAVHASNRLASPALRLGERLAEVSWSEALGRVAEALGAASPGEIGVVGGSRLTNEDAYAFAKLLKGVIGADSVDAQLGDGLPAEIVLGLPRATIDEALAARVVVLATGDVREELPVLYLRLRAAARDGLELLELSSAPGATSEHALEQLAYLPGELARLAQALVGNGEAGETAGVAADQVARARRHLGDGDGVVVVLGHGNLAESPESIASAAAILHAGLPRARFLPGLRRANVHGALDMGLAPGLAPGRVGLADASEELRARWPRLPEARGRSTREILEAAAGGGIAVLVLLCADPFSDFPDQTLARRALEGASLVVALGTHADATNARADVVLPLAGDGERAGSTTNLEGRVSHLSQKVVPPALAWPAWTVAAELAHRLGTDLGFESLDEITDEIALVAPSHRGLDARALRGPGARDGLVVPLASAAVAPAPRPIDPIATPGIASTETQGAPQRVGLALPPTAETEAEGEAEAEATEPPARAVAVAGPTPSEPVVAGRLDSYSYRLVLARTLYDGGTLVQASPSLAGLVPAPTLRAHPLELARLGTEDGASLRVHSARASVVVTARADASIPRQVVALEHRVGEGATALLEAGAHACDVHLESTAS